MAEPSTRPETMSTSIRTPAANGSSIRVAVVGTGDFGRNHARVYRQLERTELVGIVDTNLERATRVAAEFSTVVLPGLDALQGKVDAVSVAVPTAEHARIGCRLLEQGIDVFVEKPMAASIAEADQLIAVAAQNGRVLQVGHVERFNPAIMAVMPVIQRPLYFEVHRLGVFTPRSLDVDVVYDVMIHDLDILLALTGAMPVEVRSLGIPVVTDKVDIAHARLEFPSGAVANVTASRVSVERVRKLRFFQQQEISRWTMPSRRLCAFECCKPGHNLSSIFSRSPSTGRSHWKVSCERL